MHCHHDMLDTTMTTHGNWSDWHTLAIYQSDVDHYEVTKYNVERPVKFFLILVVVVVVVKKVVYPNIYSWLFHSCRSSGDTILFTYLLWSFEHALLRLPVQR
jgi:hypothetical protein